MLKRENLYVGALVWWDTTKKRNVMDQMNFPCVIVEISDMYFRFRALTEYKERDCHVFTGHFYGEYSYHALDDMRLCSVLEVKHYLDRLERRLVNDVERAEKSLEQSKKRLQDFQTQTADFLAPYLKLKTV